MPVPARTGVDERRWLAEVVRRDRERDKSLVRLDDPVDSDGIVVIWYRRPQARRVAHIQPGIADDLPSLLSSLAAEIAWPGVPGSAPTVSADAADRAAAVWARSWQVRDGMDLRINLYWDHAEQFHGEASLRGRDGSVKPLLHTADLVEMLDRLAVRPETSQSPHGCLVAGNRAIQEEDYQAARAYYLRAVNDLPNHPEAHRNLALVLARLEQWEAAAQTMGTALDLAPADPMLRAEYLALETDAGIKAVERDDLERASRHFLRILDRWPDEPTALANLGNLRRREGRTREARAIYQRYLRFHPDHPGAETIRRALAEMD